MSKYLEGDSFRVTNRKDYQKFFPKEAKLSVKDIEDVMLWSTGSLNKKNIKK